MRTASVCVAVVLIAAPSGIGAAQQAASPAPAAANANEEGPKGGAIVGGVGLGAAGFLAGGLTGAVAAGDCGSEYDEFCRLAGAFVGAAVGGTFGMALGVHLGDHRRGNFALDLATGAAVWVTGISIAAAGHWGHPLTETMFVVIPIGQLAATVAVERAVGRSRSKGRRITMQIAPHADGRTTLAVSVPF